MRPAVHASILRNRSQRSRRVMRPHTFSMRRLLMLAFIGSMFFIPGVVLFIVGLEKTPEEMEKMQGGRRIMYQAVGPALTTLGLAFLFSACVYYYCYGTGESNRMPAGSHQSSINSDPLHHHHHHHHGHHHHGHHHHHHLLGHHSHHNGSHLNTPDGSVRRLSFKDEKAGIEATAEEQVPLAVPESEHGTPPVAIRVDRAPDIQNQDDAQEREHLMNGEGPSRDPSPV